MSATPADEAHFDIRALQALEEGDPEGMADLLDDIAAIYEDDARQRIEAIAQALAANDADAVHHNTHPMCSASGSLGLMRMQTLCREIDTPARAGDLGPARARLEELRGAFEAGCAWLTAQRQAYRQRGAG